MSLDNLATDVDRAAALTGSGKEYEQANGLVQSALKELTWLPTDRDSLHVRGEAHRVRAVILRDRGRANEAVRHFLRARSIADGEGDNRRSADLLIASATAYLNVRDVDRAASLLPFIKRDVYKAKKNRPLYLEAMARQVAILEHSANYELAAHLQGAIVVPTSSEIEGPSMHAARLNAQARLLLRAGKASISKIESCISAAQDCLRERPHPIFEVVNLAVVGEVGLMFRDLCLAEKCVERAQTLTLRHGFENQHLNSLKAGLSVA